MRVLLYILLAVLTNGAVYGQDTSFPAKRWAAAPPSEMNLNADALRKARDYALSGDGSGIIIAGGKAVMRWGDQARRYDLKSSSKSIGLTAFGLAMADGKLSVDDRAAEHHPSFGIPPKENKATGWLDQITLAQLATQTAGFAKRGGYERLLFKPGTAWYYSDGGPNWLAECVTLAYQRDLEDLLFERVFSPIGITPDDLRWRNHAYRPHQIDGVVRREFGSGVHANVPAMARIGYLYLRNGRWGDEQLLPADFCRLVGRTPDSIADLPEYSDTDGNEGAHGDASQHYGLLWWNNNDGALPDVPRDAYWSWGLYDSLIVVIPSLDIVAARAGRSWKRTTGAAHYDVLAPFLTAIARVAERRVGQASNVFPNAPYPASKRIIGIDWAPPETIVRLAKGSDNWPLAWAADGSLYTAYGDGWGFEPKVEKKLSLGFAQLTGPADDPRGRNIRSPSGEATGQGANGIKASGMLCVDGTTYLLARNYDNSRLAWSTDHCQTWQWAPWQLTNSFGCPCFLGFGKDYENARDQYVYIYSPDSESAYQAADTVVLARVPRDQILDRSAYEFFAGLGEKGLPRWDADIEKRKAVFANRDRCYRMSVQYHPALKRYLLVQTLPDSEHPQGPRFEGGFGIYEAPEPWGPWSTVFFTEHWDVGPGETASLPPKWSSDDGKELHLVFSGNDCFSVRRANVRLAPSDR